jgi:hypothetical protein
LSYEGSVEIANLYMRIIDITTLNNCTNLGIDIWDGSSSESLSRGAPNGTDISGAPVGSYLVKGEDCTEDLVFLSGAAGNLFEPTYKKVGYPLEISAKEGVDNFVRICFSTTDNPVDFTLCVCVRYDPLFPDSTVAFL